MPERKRFFPVDVFPKEEELRMMKADMAKWVESLLMLRMRM